jgi:ADP-ribose pyrophosphatase
MTKPDDAHLIEQKVGESRELLKGNFLHVVRDTVRLPNGKETGREYILHPGAVAVVPFLDDGRLVLERQYRYPVGRVMIEIPAGKLDAGEAPLTCARRELLEETGYTAREWARAAVMHPAIGYADEAIEIWFARGLTLTQAHLDDEEFVEVITATPEEFLGWCRDGLVTDSKTLSAALWVQNTLSGSWKLDWRSPD